MDSRAKSKDNGRRQNRSPLGFVSKVVAEVVKTFGTAKAETLDEFRYPNRTLRQSQAVIASHRLDGRCFGAMTCMGLRESCSSTNSRQLNWPERHLASIDDLIAGQITFWAGRKPPPTQCPSKAASGRICQNSSVAALLLAQKGRLTSIPSRVASVLS